MDELDRIKIILTDKVSLLELHDAAIEIIRDCAPRTSRDCSKYMDDMVTSRSGVAETLASYADDAYILLYKIAVADNPDIEKTLEPFKDAPCIVIGMQEHLFMMINKARWNKARQVEQG